MQTTELQEHIQKAIDKTTGGPCGPMDIEFAAATAKYMDLYDHMSDKDALGFIISILQEAHDSLDEKLFDVHFTTPLVTRVKAISKDEAIRKLHRGDVKSLKVDYGNPLAEERIIDVIEVEAE